MVVFIDFKVGGANYPDLVYAEQHQCYWVLITFTSTWKIQSLPSLKQATENNDNSENITQIDCDEKIFKPRTSSNSVIGTFMIQYKHVNIMATICTPQVCQKIYAFFKYICWFYPTL